MKILSVKLTNFQKLENLSLDANGRIVYILGKNESGKSTLWRAIEGVCLRKGFSAKPITKGKEKGAVEILVGKPNEPEWKIVQKFSEANPEGTIEVVSCNNAQLTVKKPVAFLKEILGDIQFEINDFLRLSAKEKANVIKKIAGLDFTELDNQRKEHYENRTLIGREGERLKASVEAIGIPETDYELYAEERQAGDISKRIQDAIAHNTLVNSYTENLKANKSESNILNEEIKELKKDVSDYHTHVKKAFVQTKEQFLQIGKAFSDEEPTDKFELPEFTEVESCLKEYSRLRTATLIKEEALEEATIKFDAFTTAISDAEKFLSENKSIDVESIQKEYDTLIDYNTNRAKVLEAKRLTEELEKKRQEYKDLTEKINGIDHEKERLIREAKMPVEGLGFDEEELTLNGLPFDEKTQSKSILAITAVKIYMAMKPQFPVVYLDASTLDSDNLRELDAFMRENDLQGFIEKVVDGEGLTVKYEIE